MSFEINERVAHVTFPWLGTVVQVDTDTPSGEIIRVLWDETQQTGVYRTDAGCVLSLGAVDNVAANREELIMKFEINERVIHAVTRMPGTVVNLTEHHVDVLWDGAEFAERYREHNPCLQTTGIVANPPPHANSVTLFEPLPDSEVAAEVAGALGMKYDGDKPRMDLLLDGAPNALEQVASILTFGAKKYADHSWQAVPNGAARYKAALLRHLTAHAKGELNDAESGMPHLAHAACNALFILELEQRASASI